MSGLSRRIYRTQIPIFLVSVIATVIIMEYFLGPYTLLRNLKSELSSWGSIIFLSTLLFGYVTLILWSYKRVTAGKEKGRGRPFFHGVVTLGSLIFFIALALAFPGGTEGESYQQIYTYTISMMGTVLYWNEGPIYFYNIFRSVRLTSINTVALFTTLFFTVARESSLFVWLWPPFNDIGSWIETVPQMAASRGTLLAVSVGEMILGIRALIGKEPGLIEMEAV